jgi:hypothetical protein
MRSFGKQFLVFMRREPAMPLQTSRGRAVAQPTSERASFTDVVAARLSCGVGAES